MTKTLQNLRLRLWQQQAESRLGRYALLGLRALDALIAVFAEGRLSLWAMSLVYTTLLSLTPFLALSFSLLKALGVHNSLEPLLMQMLKALGPAQAQQVATTVIEFVSKVQVGVLGSVGVALLLYSAISLIQKVESAFNGIWHAERQRGLPQRLTEYLAVLMVGPVVVFSALGLTAGALSSRWVTWLAQLPPLGFLFGTIAAALPYVLMVGMFTFLYGFIPNARVRPRAAFAGGVVAGLLWQTLSFVFAMFVSGATNYNAIYSGFAIVIFVLIWLYLSWLVLLAGSQIAYFVQYPERMSPLRIAPVLAGRAREQLGLALMALVASRFIEGTPPVLRTHLAKELFVTDEALALLAAPLLSHGYLADSADAWLPAKDPASYSLATLWQHLRGAAPLQLPPAGLPCAVWLHSAEQAAGAQGAMAFRDWLLSVRTAGEKTAASQ